MKKLLFIATIMILVFSLFCVSCTQEPEPKDNMTDSYRAARQKVHDSSDIWLPELEGIEITNTDINEDGAKPLVNISFAGDETLFDRLHRSRAPRFARSGKKAQCGGRLRFFLR